MTPPTQGKTALGRLNPVAKAETTVWAHSDGGVTIQQGDVRVGFTREGWAAVLAAAYPQQTRPAHEYRGYSAPEFAGMCSVCREPRDHPNHPPVDPSPQQTECPECGTTKGYHPTGCTNRPQQTEGDEAARTAPNVLTCPECGVVTKGSDQEGAMCCENGHTFWDTNAPEWIVLRERNAAKSSLTAAEQRAEKAEEMEGRWQRRAKLAEACEQAIKQTCDTQEERRKAAEADKDRLQRERDKLRFEAMLHVQEIPLEPAAQNSWLKHEVERLQRENERLRAALGNLVEAVAIGHGKRSERHQERMNKGIKVAQALIVARQALESKPSPEDSNSQQ